MDGPITGTGTPTTPTTSAPHARTHVDGSPMEMVVVMVMRYGVVGVGELAGGSTD